MSYQRNSTGLEGRNSGNDVNYTLKDLIASKGWKQTDLADRVGKDRAVICRIIKGTQEPGRDLMIKIAQVLGVDSRVIWPDKVIVKEVCRERPSEIIKFVKWSLNSKVEEE